MTTRTEAPAAQIMLERIQRHLMAGRTVQVSTHGRSTLYKSPRWAEGFRRSENTVQVRRGRNWDIIATWHRENNYWGASIRFLGGEVK